MSLRSRSHVKASMVLKRADHLCIQLYNITSKLYFKTHFIKCINGPDEARTLATEPYRQFLIYT